MLQGSYEQVIARGLRRLGTGPWTMHDLARASMVVTDELASEYGADRAAVLDWLQALGADDRLELLLEANQQLERRAA